jgi:chromosome partitioning protein
MKKTKGNADILCFANNKGGVGKTTTVRSIGEAFALKGKKTLLVDLDSQANLTTLLMGDAAFDAENTIREALVNQIPVSPVKIKENLDLVPANLRLSKIDIELAGMEQREFQLMDALVVAATEYDYILLDCPPALGLMTYNALVACNYFVLVTTPDSLSYAGMTMISELAGKISMNPRMNPGMKCLGVIVSRYKSNKLNNGFVNLIKKETGAAFVDVLVPDRTAMQQATAYKKSIFDYDASSPVAESYTKIAEILETRMEN